MIFRKPAAAICLCSVTLIAALPSQSDRVMAQAADTSLTTGSLPSAAPVESLAGSHNKPATPKPQPHQMSERQRLIAVAREGETVVSERQRLIEVARQSAPAPASAVSKAPEAGPAQVAAAAPAPPVPEAKKKSQPSVNKKARVASYVKKKKPSQSAQAANQEGSVKPSEFVFGIAKLPMKIVGGITKFAF